MTKNTQNNTYYQEWGYLKGRQFLLTILAIGSILTMFRLGTFVGSLISPNTNTIFTFQLTFVFLGYLGIDWVLANALAGYSTLNEGETIVIDNDTGKRVSQQNPAQRLLWKFALTALFTTLVLSIVSNLFISSEMAGESELKIYNQQLIGAIKSDSTLKMKAFSTIENAGQQQAEMITQAQANKKAYIAKAITEGSASWQADYQKHKNNPRGWFWTCKDCPSGYKNYRDNIKVAIERGDQEIAAAQNYLTSIQNSLAPTLSYQLSQDSTLHLLSRNVETLEQERKWRQRIINYILLVVTLGSGLLALVLSTVIREHRLAYGQQVEENHVRLIMYLVDMLERLGTGLSDLIYTLTVQPSLWLKNRGYISEYQLIQKKPEESTHGKSRTKRAATAKRKRAPKAEKHASVSDTSERVCETCHTDISHKRSDAKYCSDTCRWEANGFKKMNGYQKP